DEINPADHLPDMSLTDLLLELKKMFCLGFNYSIDDGTFEIFFLKGLIDNAAAYVESARFHPEYEIEHNSENGLALSFEWDDADANAENIAGTDLDAYIIGDGEREIVSKISTVVTKDQKKPFSANLYKVP